jgi:hypothetical protein
MAKCRNKFRTIVILCTLSEYPNECYCLTVVRGANNKKKLILKNRKGERRKKWPSYVNTNFILSNFHNFEIFSWLLETHFIHQIFMLFMPEYSIPLIGKRVRAAKYKRFFIIEKDFLCVLRYFRWRYKILLLLLKIFVLELSQNKKFKMTLFRYWWMWILDRNILLKIEKHFWSGLMLNN